MTLDDIRSRLEEIASLCHDDEVAHIREDALYFDLLMFLAQRDDDVGALCNLALQSGAIGFERWCA